MEDSFKIKNDVFNKYLEIKLDLVNNLREIFNRQHYYTHKYRGNRMTDINVALDLGPDNEKIIQIFVRHKGIWVRDVLSFYNSEKFNSNVTTNIYESE